VYVYWWMAGRSRGRCNVYAIRMRMSKEREAPSNGGLYELLVQKEPPPPAQDTNDV